MWAVRENHVGSMMTVATSLDGSLDLVHISGLNKERCIMHMRKSTYHRYSQSAVSLPVAVF